MRDDGFLIFSTNIHTVNSVDEHFPCRRTGNNRDINTMTGNSIFHNVLVAILVVLA